MAVTMNITYQGNILLFMLNYYLKPDFQDEVWAFNLLTAAIIACGSPQFIIKGHSQHWVPWTHRAAWWAYPGARRTCVTVETWTCQSSYLWPKKADCANFTERIYHWLLHSDTEGPALKPTGNFQHYIFSYDYSFKKMALHREAMKMSAPILYHSHIS